jgi:hypothetical protein
MTYFAQQLCNTNLERNNSMRKKLLASLCMAACLAIPFSYAAPQKTVAATANTIHAMETTENITIPVYHSLNNLEPQKTGIYTLSSNETKNFQVTLNKTASVSVLFNSSTFTNGSIFVSVLNSSGTTVDRFSVSSSSNSYTEVRNISTVLSAGTYTLSVKGSYALSSSVTFQASLFGITASQTDTINISEQKIHYTALNKVSYHKIKINKNGLLKLNCFSFYNSDFEKFLKGSTPTTSGTKVTLCNSKKKALSSYSYAKTKSPAKYAVKKGTYYIKVYGFGAYDIIKPTFTTANVGTKSKKKAVTITKTYKNYISPIKTSKSAATKWFKIKVPKAKKISLFAKYQGSGSITVEVFKGNKSCGRSSVYNGGVKKFTMTNFISRKEIKWTKGTYYVKVSKYKKDYQGMYSLKIK